MPARFRFASLIACALLATPFARAASDVTISGAATTGGTFSGGNPEVFTPAAATATANVTTIQSALAANKSVQISTVSGQAAPGDLTLSSALSKTGAGAASLTLNATRHLTLSSNVTASAGSLALNFTAGGNLAFGASTTSTNGGNITLASGGTVSLGAANSLNAGAGSITLSSGILSATGTPTLTAGAGFTAASGATLALRANISGPASVAGTLSPAGLNAAGTVQITGTLTLAPSTTTIIELGGTSPGSGHDRLTASGAVTLAGALQVALINNFHDTISGSTTFTIVQGASVSGTFSGHANGSRYTLPGDLGSMRVNYTATTVTLDDWQPVVTDLTWDPGSAEAGTEVRTHTATRSGRHYYRVTTQATDIGAWRTRLTLSSGEAALYLRAGTLPTTGSFTHASTQTGSDGLVLRDDQYTVGDQWYILVNAAAPGAQWSLFSGRAYVHDLGALPFTDTNANSQYDIGEASAPQNAPAAPMPPEGIRFYKSTVPLGTPAWSLWLNGSTRNIALRTGKVPFQTSSSYYARIQSGQMLVVPSVLGAGSNAYFLSVVAPMGESIGLDSRIQQVQDIAFPSTTANVAVTGAPYRVYRTTVPVDQIAWEIATTTHAGNPNVAVRKNNVAAEWDNDAFSEAPGAVGDTITLVPDFLTNGTWFVTVYGAGDYNFSLKSGNPVVTPVAFTDLKTNDQTTRAGWRYYALTDIPAQLGALGWELLLSNQVPGTEIAIRRNKVPSRWQYRSNGSTSASNSAAHLDHTGSTGFLQRPGHQADIWYVGIYTPQQALGAFSLDVHPLVAGSTTFDSGTISATNLEPGRWKFHRIEVPSGVLGWDVRLKDVVGGTPQMVIRRDQLPLPSGTISAVSQEATAWPSGGQIDNDYDWTKSSYDTGSPTYSVSPPRLVLGMGRPLEPGTYYVGVYNAHASASTSYTIDSRGIGSGLTYPVTDLAYAGGTATVTNLAPREARYFKVSIPANTPSWELTLAPSSGEMLLAVSRGSIPNFASSKNGDARTSQIKMQKAGAERYVMLPPDGQDYIVAGDYYIATVSEGINPANSVIGTGSSSGTLTSVGPLVVTDLGTASAAGSSTPVTLAAGQLRAFRFTVPVGTASLEVRLDNRVGINLVNVPSLFLSPGSRLPDPYFSNGAYGAGAYNSGGYGYDGGNSANRIHAPSILTVANPSPGIFSLLIRVGPTTSDGTDLPDSSATLVVRQLPRLPLNYSSSLNAGNGQSHADTRQLLDGQKAFYEVPIPATLAGQPVLGWILRTTTQQGAVSLKVYKTWGNADGAGITVTGRTAVIVPPFLTPGDTWYVEATGTGLTNYTLASEPITLTRPVWTLPLGHNATFGDSGNDGAGNPLPGDRGIDLGQDDWHFFAVDVPEGNAGLLRTELQAINGNPNLYIREDGVPTTDHYSLGQYSGTTLAPRSLTQTASEYGNWVPLDGKTEKQLRAGRWYLGVKATGGTNARYRLIVSNGQVTDLALNGGSAANHTLVGRDWRYYRFTVPADAPNNWSLTFTQQVGDVVMWLRDTLPPGNRANGTETDHNSGLLTWSYDSKNQGPYASAGHDDAGSYSFATPPLRPGATYYVGFRAKSDSTFSLTSATAGGSIGVVPALDFYTGSLAIEVPANGSVLYRIPVPAEATRLKWTSTHANTVQLRLEQGTLPATTGSQHYSGSGANSSLNYALSTASWPWQPGQTYYLRIVNNAATAAPVTLALAGKNAATEDEDNDGLPDAWERSYFTSIYSHGAASDPDGDGVTNAVEYADGTNPNDINSALYFLNVSAGGGSVTRSAVLAKYPRGSVVTLTATPNAGLSFIAWTGSLSSGANPLAVTMTADQTLTANFGPPLGAALDTSGLVWTTGGASVWFSQGATTRDGVDALQSGAIGHSGETWVQTTVTGPGELSFWWKVSSQPGGDYLQFHLDGVQQSGAITGTVDWTKKTYTLAAGVHTLRWRYIKDGSAVAGSDAAWLDEVSWTASDPYLAWSAARFTGAQLADAAISGKTADPDGDGIPNLLEFVLGGSPLAADPALRPTTTLAPGGNNLVYTYRRKLSASAVSQAVQYTANLASPSWTSAVHGVEGVTIVVTTLDAETEQVAVTIPLSGGKVFARLSVGH